MRAASVILLVALAACGESAHTSEPTPPVRPAVPDGWRIITTDADDVSLVVPPDLIVMNTSGSISGFRDAAAGIDELIVSVTGPARVEQRAPGESLEDWVTRGNWLTAGRGEPVAITQREVLLSAGPALETIAAYRFGNEDRWTMLNVIDTGQGYAVLQFDGGGPMPAEPSDEVRLMRELVELRP